MAKGNKGGAATETGIVLPGTPADQMSSNFTPPAPVGNGDGKPVESKADKFRRLGSKRVAKAIKVLSQVRTLANRSQYEFTSEQAAKVITALNDSVKQIAEAFTGSKKKAETFDL